MLLATNDNLELYTDDGERGYVFDTATKQKYPEMSVATIITRGNWIMVDDTVEKGGEGSGFHGHAGRPGKVGGSSSSSNPKEETLHEYLKQVSSISDKSAEHVVLQHGKYYNPQPLPKGYKRGRPKECYANAYKLSQREGLTYVEGFAMPDFMDFPVQHAWVVDEDGNVIDNTWSKPGTAYIGIPFDDQFVASVLSETGTYGVISFHSKAFRDAYYKEATITFKGGEGSGFHGHAGRPGKVGGSASSSTAYPMLDPNGKDTQSRYMDKDGNWTPERKALHAKIINSFFEGKTPVDNPTSYILGGGPAAGKTTIVKSGLIDLPENMVLAGGDDIKPMLPEYDKEGAVFVHEESSYLSKEIAKRAAAESYNLIMDGTGDSRIEQLAAKVKTMRTHGQQVHGIYVTIDTQTAIARSIERARRTGRIMPESVLRAAHKAVSSIFPDIVDKGIMDSVSLYDTSFSPPKLIAKAVGTELTVHDAGDYQKFLAKASE